MATVLPAFNPVAGVAEALGPTARFFAQRKFDRQQLARQLQQQQLGIADQQALAQFIQQQRSGGGIQQDGQLPPIPQSILAGQLPNLQTLGGGNALLNFLGQQQTPTQSQQAQANLALTQAQTQKALRPTATSVSAFQEKQNFIDSLAAIPKDQRTPVQQAQLNSLTGAETEKPKAGALQVATEGDASGFATGTVFQADPQGNVKVLSEPGGEGLSRADKVKLAVTQGKEFRDTSVVKNFKTVQTMERNIKAALKRALDPNVKSKAFADQALVIGFNKLLDPTSVVRESEFARTPQGTALLNRLEAGVRKIKEGGVGITNEDRQELADVANELLTQSKVAFNETFSDFKERAEQIGLNEKIIFGKQKLLDIAVIGNTEGVGSGRPERKSRFGLTPTNTDELRRINAEIAELEAQR